MFRTFFILMSLTLPLVGCVGLLNVSGDATSYANKAVGSGVSIPRAEALADGIDTVAVTVTLRDSSGKALRKKKVVLASSRGSKDTITPSLAISDSAGEVLFSVKSLHVGEATLTVQDLAGSTILGGHAVSFVVGPVSTTRSAIAVSPATAKADGVNTATITVTLRDAADHPIPNENVFISSSRALAYDGVSPASALTDDAGVATFTVKSKVAGLVSFTAVDAVGAALVSSGVLLLWVAPPFVSEVNPAGGSPAGGTAVTITGSGFESGATVTIGGVACAGVSVVSATSLTCTTGALNTAAWSDVVVTNPDTQSGTLNGGFVYAPSSCLDLKNTYGVTTDGTYPIDGDGVGGRPAFELYCHDMANTAQDFLTLVNTGPGFNHSTFVNDGAAGGGCNNGVSSVYQYTKVQINPATLVVDQQNGSFRTNPSTGSCTGYSYMYAMPGDCRGAGIIYGTANVDLRGTQFRIPRAPLVPAVVWGPGINPSSWLASGSITFSSADQVADLTGGGFCGHFSSLLGASDVGVLGSLFFAAMPAAVAITAPAAASTMDAGTMANFTVSGTCNENNRPVVITGDARGVATCTNNAWSINLDFTYAPDGAVSITSTLVDSSNNSVTDTRAFTKTP